MILSIDLDAIRHNARIVRQSAERAGMTLAVVVKDPFASAEVLDVLASTGIDYFWTSFPSPAGQFFSCVPVACRGAINLTTPADAVRIVTEFSASHHVCEETLRACAAVTAANGRPHTAWLNVLTSDDREGLRLDEIRSRFSGWRRLFKDDFVLGGLLANWGCRHERPPSLQEIGRVFAAADLGFGLPAKPVPLSIGGSALLPILSHVPVRPGTQLRIGEAIIAGTIPGVGTQLLRLRRTFKLQTKIVQIRADPRSGRILGLINCGSNVLKEADFAALGEPCAGEWSSSGLTALDLHEAGHELVVGDPVELTLGYASAVRALSSRTVELRYIDSNPRRDRAA